MINDINSQIQESQQSSIRANKKKITLKHENVIVIIMKITKMKEKVEVKSTQNKMACNLQGNNSVNDNLFIQNNGGKKVRPWK